MAEKDCISLYNTTSQIVVIIAIGEIMYEHTGKIIAQRFLDVEGPK